MARLFNPNQDHILSGLCKITTILLVLFLFSCVLFIFQKGYKSFFTYSIKQEFLLDYGYLAETNGELKPEYNFVAKNIDNKKHLNNVSEQDHINLHELFRANGLEKKLNYNFFLNGNSYNYNNAGIRIALIGTILSTIFSVMFATFIAIFIASYLYLYVGKRRKIIYIFVNAVNGIPSIIYGVIALSILVNTLNLNRSSILLICITLTFFITPFLLSLTLQTLESLPKSQKEAMIALGANKINIISGLILPYLKTHMLNIIILSVLRLIGETAPLIIIGGMSFIANKPESLHDAATTLPVQIYLWFNSPVNSFEEKSAGAILILLSIISILCYIGNKLKGKI